MKRRPFLLLPIAACGAVVDLPRSDLGSAPGAASKVSKVIEAALSEDRARPVFDQLGAVDRWELYHALIVDAKSKDCAHLLLMAAIEDPLVNDSQEAALLDVFNLNHGNKKR